MSEVRLMVALKAQIKFDQAANVYVSYCPELDIHSQGTSVDDSKKALSNTINTYFRTAFETKSIDTVLKKHGFKAIKSSDGNIAIVKSEEVKGMAVADPSPSDSPRSPGDGIDVEQVLKMAFSPPTSWREMPEVMACPSGHDAFRRVVKEGEMEIPCYSCVHCMVLYRYQECGASNREDYGASR